MKNEKPHPDNVEGPFYVADGCCTACGVPEAFAPGLFGADEGGHCYVKRQPETVQETEAALRVMHTQELGCIRYRGTDLAILQRLADAGEADQCDVALPEGRRPRLRNHVTFTAASSEVCAWSSARVLQDFEQHLLNRSGPTRFRTTPVVEDLDEARFLFAWYENHFRTVTIRPVMGTACDWLVRHSFNIGLSETIHDWLKQSTRFGNIRWYTEGQWNGTKVWLDRPW